MNRMSVAVLLASTVLATGQTGAADSENACMQGPMAQFGRYVGDWKIDDEALKKDGSAWEPGQGARWTFTCIGDGLAVQDFWMPNGGGFGTNLRTYNPDTGAWEIVWAAQRLNGLMHISAMQDDSGAMRMDILSPEQDPPRRITFFPPDGAGWDWVMEWSLDGGTSWIEVYRIRATPWAD